MSLVSNNCYGVAHEKSKGKEYTTPFFSVFILAPDYIKLLEDFDNYIKLDPVAVQDNVSRHYIKNRKYPVLLLGDVEIHCPHDKDWEKAIEKWCRRRDRMDLDKSKMIVKMCDRDKFSVSIGQRFLALNEFPNKRLFVSQKYKDSFEGIDNIVVTKDKTRCVIGTKLEKQYPVEKI